MSAIIYYQNPCKLPVTLYIKAYMLAFPGRLSKNWWWDTKFWLGHVPWWRFHHWSSWGNEEQDFKASGTFQASFDPREILGPRYHQSLKIPPRTPGIRLFMLLLWGSVGRRRHLRLESLWMAMNLNRNDIMTVWNKCFFFAFHKQLKSLVPNPEMCKMRQKIIASIP